jgi:hypothetical protein
MDFNRFYGMSMDEGMIHEVGKYYPFAGLISTMDPR